VCFKPEVPEPEAFEPIRVKVVRVIASNPNAKVAEMPQVPAVGPDPERVAARLERERLAKLPKKEPAQDWIYEVGPKLGWDVSGGGPIQCPRVKYA